VVYDVPVWREATVHPDHHISFGQALYSLPPGGRATDPDDYPAEKTAYALRAPDRIVQQAGKLGPNVAAFAEKLFEGPLPWAKLRQGQKLLRLAEKYTATRLEAACAHSLAHDLVDVRRLERILVLALEQAPEPEPAPPAVVVPLPSRFARPGSAFDHRQACLPLEALS
jgi:hypothetical protein